MSTPLHPPPLCHSLHDGKSHVAVEGGDVHAPESGRRVGGGRWGIQVRVGGKEGECMVGNERDLRAGTRKEGIGSGEEKGNGGASPSHSPATLQGEGWGGVSAADFRNLRAAKHNRSAAIAAKAAASSIDSAASSGKALKDLVKESLGQVISPASPSAGSKPESKDKRGGKRWDQSEVANLYQHWREARGIDTPPKPGDNRPHEMSTHSSSGVGGVGRGGGGGTGVRRMEEGDELKAEGDVVLWRGDGVVLGVPNVLDAAVGES